MEENEIPEWLNGPFMSEEEQDEAMSAYQYIIERRLENRENENYRTNHIGF